MFPLEKLTEGKRNIIIKSYISYHFYNLTGMYQTVLSKHILSLCSILPLNKLYQLKPESICSNSAFLFLQSGHQKGYIMIVLKATGDCVNLPLELFSNFNNKLQFHKSSLKRCCQIHVGHDSKVMKPCEEGSNKAKFFPLLNQSSLL